MKSTGIVRKLDELGRIVIPKEIRKKLEISQKDSIEIRTKDFITYTYTLVEYKYDEDMDMHTPYSWNSTYELISNKDKNKIIKLAQKKNYNTSKNLSDNDFKTILKIIFENDKKDLKTLI